jgi:hypothetical protein
MKICTRAATVAVEVECGGAGGASRRFSTPSQSARVRSVGATVAAANLVSRAAAPTPCYSDARQGPTSLLPGWASPIRTRVKGLMGRWAHWWRDQSNTRKSTTLSIDDFYLTAKEQV